MVIYLDNEFKCHTANDGTMISIETNFFNDKSPTFIEGYRFIPSDSTWTREDGVVFTGEMVSPWKPYDELDAAQREYEQQFVEAAKILLGGI